MTDKARSKTEKKMLMELNTHTTLAQSLIYA